MPIPTRLALLLIIAAPLAGLVQVGCSSSPGTTTGGAGKGGAGKGGAGTGAGSAGTGSAGTGAAGTGSAGTGAAGTGNAGTGAAGTGSAGTGAAGTGSAGTGAAGTGSAGTGTDGGAGTGTDGATDKSTDVPADTGSSPDVAADMSSAETAGSDAAIACVSITLPAAVFAHYLTTAAPAAAGGDIVDGTYALTELNHYGSATAMTSNDPIRSAIKFAGNTIEWANQAKQEAATGSSFTYVKATNKLTLTNVCPTAGPGNGPGYTATATTFKLYLDAEYVYTKL